MPPVGLAEVMVVLRLEARPSRTSGPLFGRWANKKRISHQRSSSVVASVCSWLLVVVLFWETCCFAGGAELAAILRYGTSVSAEHPPAAEGCCLSRAVLAPLLSLGSLSDLSPEVAGGLQGSN